MNICVHVTIEHENGQFTGTIARLQREELRPETLGLTLTEAKTLLATLQGFVVSQQVAEHNGLQCCCPDCGAHQAKKDSRHITYRILFDKFKLDSPRYYTCNCQPAPKAVKAPGPTPL